MKERQRREGEKQCQVLQRDWTRTMYTNKNTKLLEFLFLWSRGRNKWHMTNTYCKNKTRGVKCRLWHCMKVEDQMTPARINTLPHRNSFFTSGKKNISLVWQLCYTYSGCFSFTIIILATDIYWNGKKIMLIIVLAKPAMLLLLFSWVFLLNWVWGNPFKYSGCPYLFPPPPKKKMCWRLGDFSSILFHKLLIFSWTWHVLIGCTDEWLLTTFLTNTINRLNTCNFIGYLEQTLAALWMIPSLMKVRIWLWFGNNSF